MARRHYHEGYELKETFLPEESTFFDIDNATLKFNVTKFDFIEWGNLSYIRENDNVLQSFIDWLNLKDFINDYCDLSEYDVYINGYKVIEVFYFAGIHEFYFANSPYAFCYYDGSVDFLYLEIDPKFNFDYPIDLQEGYNHNGKLIYEYLKQCYASELERVSAVDRVEDFTRIRLRIDGENVNQISTFDDYNHTYGESITASGIALYCDTQSNNGFAINEDGFVTHFE